MHKVFGCLYRQHISSSKINFFLRVRITIPSVHEHLHTQPKAFPEIRSNTRRGKGPSGDSAHNVQMAEQVISLRRRHCRSLVLAGLLPVVLILLLLEPGDVLCGDLFVRLEATKTSQQSASFGMGEQYVTMNHTLRSSALSCFHWTDSLVNLTEAESPSTAGAWKCALT